MPSVENNANGNPFSVFTNTYSEGQKDGTPKDVSFHISMMSEENGTINIKYKL